MTTPSPIKKVTQIWLNQQFNENGWKERLDSASYTKAKCHDSLTPPEHGQAQGTLTIGYHYYDAQNKRVATVFHYRKPDGQLGASGHFVPKGLLIEGTWCYT